MSRFFATITLFVCLGSTLYAQVDRATLSGAVSDATGAKISAASIAVESAATGFQRTALSAGDGTYRIPGLPVGAYTVTIAKEGFRSAKYDGVVLAVGQSRTLDAELTVGQISTAIEVAATATPLEQTNAEIGAVIAEQQIKNIPLNGRHWASLMQLAPGAVSVGE
ncbi:MAG: carboxypeptidase regulatory-like domain-containing protein, partial [Bryobacterales bacterium]|nr:carboxypeptidase regulatory-like domain-containing protein [Bryobacterales bacterium]